MKNYFLRVFAYAEWGTRRSYQSILEQPTAGAGAVRYLSHLVASERVWITRLQGKDSSTLPIWPELTLQDCETLINENARAIREYLDGLEENDFTSTITYRNSKGAEFTTPVVEVLTHLAFHGGYHRGQIASAIRNAGGEPTDTDFIIFVREFPA